MTRGDLVLKLNQADIERTPQYSFDEFDVLGKERGDNQETGEIKRIVSSLLMQVDALPRVLMK